MIEVGDTAPDLTAWFRRHGVRWALQRPDFHIYGTATDVAGAAELVEHLRARLTTAAAMPDRQCPTTAIRPRRRRLTDGDLCERVRAARARRHLRGTTTYDEQLFDTGEVEINYVTAGDASRPALLLIPGQTESWWGYEQALPLLADHFQAFAVDLRGQGRSSRTPGRYTLDLIGNDLVRFIDGVIGRPTIVAGLSSGGVHLRVAFGLREARAGRRRLLRRPAAVLLRRAPRGRAEHPPVDRPDLRGHGEVPRRPVVDRRLGRDGRRRCPTELPGWMTMLAGAFGMSGDAGPPQSLKEYDPEWGRAFWTGSFYASSGDHERMLRSVKVPVLFTHHFRMIDEATGALMGASSDLQAGRVRQLVTEAGQPFDYVSLPTLRTRCTAAIRSSTSTPWSAGRTRSRRVLRDDVASAQPVFVTATSPTSADRSEPDDDHDDRHADRHRCAASVSGSSGAGRSRPPW